MPKKSLNPIDKHVGSRVRMRRMMLKMSQEKLADGLDLTFQQVQKYEKGTNRIGGSRLQQISQILQVPVSFFFEGLPGQEGAGTEASALIGEFFSLPHAAELAQHFVALKDPVRRKVVIDVARLLTTAVAAESRRAA